MIESIRMRAKRSLSLGLCLVFTSLVAACAPASPRLHGSPYTPPAPAPALELVDTAGVVFQLESLRNSVVLVYFGYTQCPDECPLTLANATWAVRELGALGDRLALILVTVDPANDTPQVMRTYLDRFDPRFIGLLGSDLQLEQARLAYGVLAATPEAGHEYSEVIHGTRLYLIDPQGRLATSYDLSVPKEDILADVRALLESGT